MRALVLACWREALAQAAELGARQVAALVGLGLALARRRAVGVLVHAVSWFFVRGAIATVVARDRLQVEPCCLQRRERFSARA